MSNPLSPYLDPRGPRRTTVAVDDSGPGWTLLTLSCGHVVERANHFSYHVGDDERCFTCKREGRS